MTITIYLKEDATQEDQVDTIKEVAKQIERGMTSGYGFIRWEIKN